MNKYKKMFFYTIWGFITTAINFSIIYILSNSFGMEELDANILAWFVSNYVMYVMIKRTVFNKKTNGIKEYVIQLNFYYLSRIFSLACEEIIIWKAVEIDGYPLMYVKIFTAIFIGVLNLFLSKYFVFNGNSFDNRIKENGNSKVLNY